jgi:hypothetical protein
MSNIETMQQIYEAFGRGDVPAILDHVADDVRWEQWPNGNAAQAADVPYMRARNGREEAAASSAAISSVRWIFTSKTLASTFEEVFAIMLTNRL